MTKIIIIFLFITIPHILSADIKYKGTCGLYEMDFEVDSNRWVDLYCYQDRMLVWDSTNSVYYNLRPVSGGQYTGLSIQTIKSNSTVREVKWFSLPKDSIKRAVSDNIRMMYALAGVLLGFLTIQLFFRSIIRR